MNINEAFEFLNFISNKNQSGSVTPAQFNRLATQAQLEFFQKDYIKWQTTQEITDAMSVFLKSYVTSLPVTGQLLFPNDYAHVTSVRHYFVRNNNTGVEVPVKEVDNDQYADYLQSEIVTPTYRYPIWTAYNDYAQFEPKSLGQVSFDYFKVPTPPIWDYDLMINNIPNANGRPVFVPFGTTIQFNTQLNGQTLTVPRPSQSTDWELGAPSQNILITLMCQYLGINLREAQLQQYAEMQLKEQA